MAEETGEQPDGCFVIDGEEYPFPLLYEGFTMDEAMVFFSYTGFALEEIIANDVDNMDADEVADLNRKASSPMTLAALMHLAYARKTPGAKEAAVRKLVKSTDFATALSKFAEAVAGDVPPTAAQNSEQPTPSSDEKPDGSSERSGPDSTTSSDQPDETLEPTGISGSVTSLTQLQTRRAG